MNKRAGAVVFWLFVLVVVIGLVVVVKRWPRREDRPEQEKPVPVTVMLLAAEPVHETVSLPGWIRPVRQSQVAAEKGGRVAAILAREGDTVTAGQVLLQLEDRVWSNLLQKASIEIRDSERELERLKALSANGAVSRSDLDRVEKVRDFARVDLEMARIEMKRCRVTSPFDGVINARFREEGEFVPEGGAAFDVVQTDRVKVALDVPERDIHVVKTGDVLPFSVMVLPGQTFTGTVVFAAAAADEQGHSYRVELEADNVDGRLRPGMVAEVALVRQEIADALVVDLAAVVPYRGDHTAFVVENGRAVRRQVVLGPMLASRVVIESGLAAGESLIVEGMRGLDDGRAVVPVSRTR